MPRTLYLLPESKATMIKAIAQSLEHAVARLRKPRIVSVALDVFGNAIPEARSAQAASSTGESRIVRREDVLVGHSRKRLRSAVGTPRGRGFKALFASTRSLLARVRRQRTLAPDPKEDARVASLLPVVRQSKPLLAQRAREGSVLVGAFQRLPQESQRQEDRLEPWIYKPHQESTELAKARRRIPQKAFPAAAVVAIIVVYLLYILGSMQGSMMAMSGNIHTMATDTHSMSQNMQAMNQSMQDMNHNVAEMNQKVGTLSRAAAPMGEAATAVSPFTRILKSILPF